MKEPQKITTVRCPVAQTAHNARWSDADLSELLALIRKVELGLTVTLELAERNMNLSDASQRLLRSWKDEVNAALAKFEGVDA